MAVGTDDTCSGSLDEKTKIFPRDVALRRRRRLVCDHAAVALVDGLPETMSGEHVDDRAGVDAVLFGQGRSPP